MSEATDVVVQTLITTHATRIGERTFDPGRCGLNRAVWVDVIAFSHARCPTQAVPVSVEVFDLVVVWIVVEQTY